MAAFTKGLGVTFPVMGKVDCEAGGATHPLYKYLRDEKGGALTWNFNYFIVDKDGKVVGRSANSPASLAGELSAML